VNSLTLLLLHGIVCDGKRKISSSESLQQRSRSEENVFGREDIIQIPNTSSYPITAWNLEEGRITADPSPGPYWVSMFFSFILFR
jgi:hypothetical protein